MRGLIRDMVRGSVLGLAALALVVVVQGRAAYAISCSAGSTCLEHMTNSNVIEFAGVDVHVTIDNSGSISTNTRLLVELITNAPVPNTLVGINQFYYNSSPLTLVSTGPSGWILNGASAAADGFGPMDVHNVGGAGAADGIGSPLVFTLAGLATSFPSNSHGSVFAVQLQYSDGCSGYVSDGTVSPRSVVSNSNCRPVPEPDSLLLVGSGLLGLVAAARLRMRGKK